MSQTHMTALRVASLLWLVWGAVHVFAGIMIIPGSATAGFQGIAAAVDPAELVHDYHPAVAAVLNQHAWNLMWGGAVTIIGAVYIWRANRTAIWVTAMVGGLLDIGYFVFIDLGGYGTWVPGTLMTLFSGSAILLTGWVWVSTRQA